MNKILVILFVLLGITVSSQEVKYFTDYRDGQTYKAVKIGTQWWMGENLNYEVDGSYCYNNTSSNCDTYGRLYLWEAAMGHDLVEGTQGVCPNGWHLPTDAEWTTLTTFLGGIGVAGGKLKEVGTTHWTTPNTGATDEYGFTGLPGGYRNNNGIFNYMGNYAYFWFSTENGASNAWVQKLFFDNDDATRLNADKESGRSVRCLKDYPFSEKPLTPIFKADFIDASLIDKVSGNLGTLTIGDGGFIKTEKGTVMEFDGSATKVVYADNDALDIGESSMTVEAIVRFDSDATNTIFSRTVDAFNEFGMAYNGTSGKLALSIYENYSVNGYWARVATSWTPTVNTWYHLIITVDQSSGDGAIYINNVSQTLADEDINSYDFALDHSLDIGWFSTTPFNGYIAKVAIWDKVLTAGERAALYTEYLRSRPKSNTYKFHLQDTTTYKTEDFKNEYADGSTVIPEGWVQGTGSYKVGETTTPILSDYHKGTKYLECTSAGTIAFPSNQAYGTWEIDVYKGNTVNNLGISLISSIQNWTMTTSDGYTAVLGSDEAVKLYETEAGVGGTLITESDGGYIANDTWYRIKVERASAGQFSVYIKGGTFGNTYTLVSTTGGSGTNPVTDNTYTESNYFVIDLDAGDRIANIKITD